MLLTEGEAREKRCCGPSGCGDYGNPSPDGSLQRYCAASACMAWSWAPLEYERDNNIPRDRPPEGDGWRWVERYSEGGGWDYSGWQRAKPRLGGCGLAGEPTP